MKFCKDCKWFAEAIPSNHSLVVGYHKCLHPECANYVTGEPMDCDILRGGRCGVSAVHFEPKGEE